MGGVIKIMTKVMMTFIVKLLDIVTMLNDKLASSMRKPHKKDEEIATMNLTSADVGQVYRTIMTKRPDVRRKIQAMSGKRPHLFELCIDSKSDDDSHLILAIDADDDKSGEKINIIKKNNPQKKIIYIRIGDKNYENQIESTKDTIKIATWNMPNVVAKRLGLMRWKDAMELPPQTKVEINAPADNDHISTAIESCKEKALLFCKRVVIGLEESVVTAEQNRDVEFGEKMIMEDLKIRKKDCCLLPMIAEMLNKRSQRTTMTYEAVSVVKLITKIAMLLMFIVKMIWPIVIDKFDSYKKTDNWMVDFFKGKVKKTTLNK